jgi:Zn-dependent protease with chaperone function
VTNLTVDRISKHRGGSLPPWLWFWLGVSAVALPAHLDLWRQMLNGILYGSGTAFAGQDFLLARAGVLAFALIYLVTDFGILTVLTPWARAAYLEKRHHLSQSPPTLPALKEMNEFIQEHAPGLQVKNNLLRTNQLAFVYPLGYRRTAIAVFGGLIKLWRSDRRAAEAVLLHEIGHFRHGDVLIVGEGSFFEAFLKYGVPITLTAFLVTGFTAIYASAATFGPVNELDWSDWLKAAIGMFPISATMWFSTVAISFLPYLAGFWCAEFNADRFAADTQGSPGNLVHAVDKLRHRIPWWRWFVFRLSHPPHRMRRRMALRSGRTTAVMLGLLLFPTAVLLGRLSDVISRMNLFLFASDYTLVSVLEYELTILVPFWLLMAALILLWPAVGRYWERLFCREGNEGVTFVWSSYKTYLSSSLIMIAMLLSSYGLLSLHSFSMTLGEAAGDGSELPKKPSQESITKGIPEGSISAGQYSTSYFEPAISFSVGEGWQVWSSDSTHELMIAREREYSWVKFQNVEGVYEPRDLKDLSEVIADPSLNQKERADGMKRYVQDLPNDIVVWLQEHPYLRTTDPVPVTIGGISGRRIDASLSSTPEQYPIDCAVPCIPTFDEGVEGTWSPLLEGRKYRFFVLKVKGEVVIIEISTPEAKFEKFMPKAEEVLDTVEWRP